MHFTLFFNTNTSVTRTSVLSLLAEGGWKVERTLSSKCIIILICAIKGCFGLVLKFGTDP